MVQSTDTKNHKKVSCSTGVVLYRNRFISTILSFDPAALSHLFSVRNYKMMLHNRCCMRAFLKLIRALRPCEAEVKDELHMNSRRNAQRSSSGQQESEFFGAATTPRLLGWRRAPQTPPGAAAESTCSNGDERPPVGKVVGANTNHLPSKPCLAALGQMFPTPSVRALRRSQGTDGEPRLDPPHQSVEEDSKQ